MGVEACAFGITGHAHDCAKTNHPGAKALKALKTGHVLHVSGAFAFQPAAGGPRLTHSVSTIVRLRHQRHRR